MGDRVSAGSAARIGECRPGRRGGFGTALDQPLGGGPDGVEQASRPWRLGGRRRHQREPWEGGGTAIGGDLGDPSADPGRLGGGRRAPGACGSGAPTLGSGQPLHGEAGRCLLGRLLGAAPTLGQHPARHHRLGAVLAAVAGRADGGDPVRGGGPQAQLSGLLEPALVVLISPFGAVVTTIRDVEASVVPDGKTLGVAQSSPGSGTTIAAEPRFAGSGHGGDGPRWRSHRHLLVRDPLDRWFLEGRLLAAPQGHRPRSDRPRGGAGVHTQRVLEACGQARDQGCGGKSSALVDERPGDPLVGAEPDQVPLPAVLGAVVTEEGAQAARVPAEVAPLAVDQFSQRCPDPGDSASVRFTEGPSRDISDYSQTSRTR